MLPFLPIDPFLPQIQDALTRARAVVVTAQPGAGKTTRVPPAVTASGPVMLLEPRRMAARAIAQRIADERQWTIGREIGWQVRFERRFGPDTQLLVATEGILTVRLQQDPLLSDFGTIVLDEFHERSIYADLAIALGRQAWRARSDLRIVVMSATIDAGSVAAFLDGCPIVEVPGRTFPVDIDYRPEQPVADAAHEMLRATAGDVLCFLPGAFEIRRAMSELQRVVDARAVEIVPLYGALAAAEQDAAIRGATDGRRRVVVATNVAETSLTVPGVAAVVDSGLHKVARYDADRAIDSLTTERITKDSADQRAGRAGRVAAGRVCRLWDPRDRLRLHREAEIHRIDLTTVVLDVMAWGGDPRELEWFDAPKLDALETAVALLERLGAVRGGALTDLGRDVVRLPLHPRLACMLRAARGARAMARACALLSERQMTPSHAATTTSDLLSAVDQWAHAPPHVQRVAAEIERLCGTPHEISETAFRRAVLAGYPDRVAQRRDTGSPRVKLSSGAGAIVDAVSGVRDGEFLVAVELRATPAGYQPTLPPSRLRRFGMPRRSSQSDRASGGGQGSADVDGQTDARIRIASRVEREWLQPNAIDLVHRFDEAAGVVRAAEIERYDALIVRERPAAPDPEKAARLLTDAWLSRGPGEEDDQLLRRLRFANHDLDLAATVRAAADGMRALADVHLARAVDPDVLRLLDARAPRALLLPSGRSARLEYLEDGRIRTSVKLQDAFGLIESPRVGPRREPVLFALLAPNGRPVQLTTDLRSFWERTYPELRKELRGRYPKHRWPEDPLTASQK